MRRWLALLLILIVALPLLGARRKKNFAKRKFVASYREILADYAAGDQSRAIDRFVVLETTASRGGNESVFSAMKEAERGVHRDVSRRRLDALPPLVRFHEDAYVAYLDRKLPRLAVLSRVMASELANAYARAADTDDAKRLASGLLTSLGGFVHAGHQEAAARALYARSIALDPENGAARLGLAALHEKRGEYGEAANVLETFSAGAPAAGEAELRRGVNLARIGALETAESALRTALGDDRPDWVRSLAAQELASLMLGAGRTDEAVGELIRAVGAFPCDPALVIQLAYVRERTGGDAPIDLVATVAGCPDRDAVPPRTRYNDPPADALAFARRGTALAVDRLRPTLAEGLS